MKDNEFISRATIIIIVIIVSSVMKDYYETRLFEDYIKNGYEQVVTTNNKVIWRKIKNKIGDK